MSNQATVIGGGIIGLSTAYYLQQSGWQVTVIDAGNLDNNCSYGNMGMVVPSHFVPLASPGIIAQGVKWMMDKRSPFYVQPSLNTSLIGWGINFIKKANRKHVERSAKPLLQLNLYSRSLFEEMNAVPGFDFGFERKGIMMYFNTQKVADEEIHLSEQARSLGLDAVPLSQKELLQLEPDAKPAVLGGIHYRCDAHLSPNLLMQQLKVHLRNAGVSFVANQPVIGFEKKNGRIDVVRTAATSYQTDLVVIAVGSWLPAVAKMAGMKIPLMPGKGYSFEVYHRQNKLNIPAILCEARVAITPMNGVIRFGGTMEIAAVNEKVNVNRVEGIVNAVANYFEGLKVSMPAKSDIWYGFRPCSPDGLPFIGRSNKYHNVLVGGGHAMMGLSLGPASGKLLSQLANEESTDIDIRPFDPKRF